MDAILHYEHLEYLEAEQCVHMQQTLCKSMPGTPTTHIVCPGWSSQKRIGNNMSYMVSRFLQGAGDTRVAMFSPIKGRFLLVVQPSIYEQSSQALWKCKSLHSGFGRCFLKIRKSYTNMKKICRLS